MDQERQGLFAPLDPGALKKRPAGALGSRVFLLARTGSTNDEAWNRLLAGVALAGDVVVAEEQTAGRGRGGNSWFSPVGAGLWFSILARPKLPPERIPWMTQVAGLSVARALRAFGVEARVKWPNDVLAGRAKIAGILCESRAAGTPEAAVAIGVGLNVNQPEDGFPPELAGSACSVRSVTGRPACRAALLDAVLDALEADLASLERGEIADLDRRIAAYSALLGSRVRLFAGSDASEGIVVSQSLESGLTIESGGRRTAFFGPHIHSVELLGRT